MACYSVRPNWHFPTGNTVQSDSRILVPRFLQLLSFAPLQRSDLDMQNLRLVLWILDMIKHHFDFLKGKMSTRIPGRKLCRRKTDKLIRTAGMWQGWTVTDPGAN